MKKPLVAILLAVILVVPFGIGTATAKTTTQGIKFNLTDGTVFIYETQAGVTNRETVEAVAVFDGVIRDKDGNTYLSPMTGKITIDGVEHTIQVKAAEVSEPIFRYLSPKGYIDWVVVEVNIGGGKALGRLDMTSTPSKEETRFQFTGSFDGKWYACLLRGTLPTID